MTRFAIYALFTAGLLDCVTPKPGGDVAGRADPRPVAPITGSLVFSRRPSVRWASSDSSVRVQFCRERACTHVLAEVTTASALVSPPVDLPDGVVFWRVLPDNNRSLDGRWLPVWWFIVDHGAQNDAAHAVTSLSLTGQFDADGDGAWDWIDENGYVRRSMVSGIAPESVLAMPGVDGPHNAGDLNGDGYLDVFTTYSTTDSASGTVYVYLGPLPHGDVAPSMTIPSMQPPGSDCGPGTLVGDFDGDGDSDLAIECSDSEEGRGRIVLVDGSPSGPVAQSPRVMYGPGGAGTWFSTLAAGDVDGDGIDDLLVGAWALGDGWIGWQQGSPFGLEGSPAWSLGPAAVDPRLNELGNGGVIGDVDGDGANDVVAASDSGQTGCIALFRSVAGGSSQDPQAIACGPGGEPSNLGAFMVAGDVDGDARADLAMVLNPQVSTLVTLSVFLGSAAGTEGGWPRSDLRILDTHSIRVPQSCDVDGDGFTDVVTHAVETGGIRVTLVARGGPLGLGAIAVLQ